MTWLVSCACVFLGSVFWLFSWILTCCWLRAMDLFYHVFVVAWIVGLISCLVYVMDCLSWFLGCHVVACIVICCLMCVMDCDLLLGVRHGLFIMVSWLPGCYMDCDLSLGVCVCHGLCIMFSRSLCYVWIGFHVFLLCCCMDCDVVWLICVVDCSSWSPWVAWIVKWCHGLCIFLVLHGFCGVCCGIWIAFGTSGVAFVVGIENGLLDVWHGLCTRYTTIFWVCCCMDCGLIVWCKSWIVYHGLSEAFWWIVFSWCVMWVARSLSRFLQTMNRNLTFMLCLLLSVSCWLWLTVVCPAWILFCFLKCFMAFVVFAGAWHGMLFTIKDGKIKGWKIIIHFHLHQYKRMEKIN